MNLTKEHLSQALNKIQAAKPKITVVGDVILDEYLIGHPERISREAPVLILEYKENYYRLGGAANAAINAASLGAQVTLIGTVGQDESQERMEEICKKNKIAFKPLVLKNKPTTLKTRVLSTNQSSSLTHNGTSFSQQVLRIDRQSRTPLSQTENSELIQHVQQVAQKADLLLLSDYSLGVLNRALVQKIIAGPQKVVVDPSGDFERFKGAFLITPNEPDTQKELGFDLSFDTKNLKLIIDSLKNKLSDRTNFLITRGAEGMLLIENGQIHQVPAFNKAEVFDVTGAGDTVSACISVALGAGLSLPEAMALGNLAASIVVRKSGSATTNHTEIKHALDELDEIGYENFKI
jgi:D-glycero-beta-D-manno-heptose-7-phosphate kinase